MYKFYFGGSWLVFIKTTLVSTGLWIKHHTRLHSLVAFLVFAVGLGATLYYWHNLRQSVQADMDAVYAKQVDAVSDAVQTRIQLYENFLRSSAGLFAVHTGLSQADWVAFHQPYDIKHKYPDIQGVGVSRYLKKDDVPAYLERRIAGGDTDFRIFPEGERDVYVPVTFNAPYTGSNGQSRGFDGYTDATRRKAMDYAVQRNAISLSGRVQLVSESRHNRSSFIMYYPVYAEGAPTNTIEERKAGLLGFSYLTLDAQTFLDSILSRNQNPHLGLQIFDAEAGKDNPPAYTSARFDAIRSQPGSKTKTIVTDTYGHKWSLTFTASQSLISARERQLPSQALWRGLITCIFFAGLVWYLITDRERKYARQKQEEVQSAKDDLLSLASHQLRTPATVVKQYVGMMLQGYAGKLSGQQIEMLHSAYDSNERQLEIINQLLYVARLDAGRITLHPKETDLTKLLQDVAHDHSEAMVARGQKLHFKLPRRPVTAEVDPHYIRMVLENLLSNAIKYTPPKGAVTLGLGRQGGEVHIIVKDTGVGIDQDVQTSIFEKFTRVENELSTDVNGSGVGLYLTKQIVELHGGSIEVHSKVRGGAVFTVRIPIHRPSEEPAPAS